MTSQSGQGVIELIIALTSVTSIVSFCFIITLIGFTKTYIQHVGYQSLICTNTDGLNKSICKKQTRELLKLLPFGNLDRLTITQKKVFIQWQLIVVNRSLFLSSSQSLTLKEWL
ncbi:MAG: hypothetical protein MK008_14850 [Bdellovibrionales bacterium]|nr:hypothetical protein [Bdellovibrionales bacterium]